jgi:polyhydroxyalkanoate synthesis regulator phasin
MTMATKKKTIRRKATVRRVKNTGEVLRETWASTLDALTAAEGKVEKQIKGLLKQNRMGAGDAAEMLKDLGARLARERKKALKQLDVRLTALQARLHKDRRVVRRMVDDAVKGTLAAFNIPSRHEVAELTKKVDELSKKIDAFKRRR